ncbi:hypothetical protein EGR_04740 [Echinococcus granulosus]|uniref:Uncharacterized protein n=1 Tax=Echinococcus granulosus TaxID=6210 RepID=W6UH52_ECHGR|nr:hypothetical protein EGR_04740 [Echinococcus granulosus]EUB60358.1 hypothetical protein EGR_04740 [Echinococcus granulosus]
MHNSMNLRQILTLPEFWHIFLPPWQSKYRGGYPSSTSYEKAVLPLCFIFIGSMSKKRNRIDLSKPNNLKLNDIYKPWSKLTFNFDHRNDGQFLVGYLMEFENLSLKLNRSLKQKCKNLTNKQHEKTSQEYKKSSKGQKCPPKLNSKAYSIKTTFCCNAAKSKLQNDGRTAHDYDVNTTVGFHSILTKYGSYSMSFVKKKKFSGTCSLLKRCITMPFAVLPCMPVGSFKPSMAVPEKRNFCIKLMENHFIKDSISNRLPEPSKLIVEMNVYFHLNYRSTKRGLLYLEALKHKNFLLHLKPEDEYKTKLEYPGTKHTTETPTRRRKIVNSLGQVKCQIKVEINTLSNCLFQTLSKKEMRSQVTNKPPYSVHVIL